jgi:hypothetical protein
MDGEEFRMTCENVRNGNITGRRGNENTANDHKAFRVLCRLYFPSSFVFKTRRDQLLDVFPKRERKKTVVNLISIARKEVRHVASRPTTTHIRYIVTSYPAAAAAGPFFSPRLFISLSSSPREFPLYLCRRWCH